MCLNNTIVFIKEMISSLIPTVFLSCDHLETSLLISSSHMDPKTQIEEHIHAEDSWE